MLEMDPVVGEEIVSRHEEIRHAEESAQGQRRLP
jgi:hypothetical protein